MATNLFKAVKGVCSDSVVSHHFDHVVVFSYCRLLLLVVLYLGLLVEVALSVFLPAFLGALPFFFAFKHPIERVMFGWIEVAFCGISPSFRVVV